MVYADGSSYDGEYEQGFRHGRGCLEKPDGTLYDGEWKHGHFHGRGKLLWHAADGSLVTYEGEFQEALRQGTGKLISLHEGEYDGQWQANLRHGRGIQISPNGMVYDGDWQCGERTGQGRLTHADGKVYYKGRLWRGFWLSLNWYHLRYWLGFLVARIFSPVTALVAAALAAWMTLYLVAPSSQVA